MTAWFLVVWVSCSGASPCAHWSAPRLAPFASEADCTEFAVPYVIARRFNGYECIERNLER